MVHCRLTVLGWVQGKLPGGAHKVFRYCDTHRAEASAFGQVCEPETVRHYTVEDLLAGKVTDEA